MENLTQVNKTIEEFKHMDLDFTHYETWQMWAVGGAGLALMLIGYKIKKIAFFIIWFLLGYIASGYLLPIINSALSEVAESNFWQGLIPILGGLLLGLMGFMIEKICLGGAVFGLTLLMTAQYFGTEIQTMVIGGIIGAVLGGVAVMMMKPATIIATSIAGGYALTLAILALAPELDAETWFWPMIVGFGALGSLIQFISCKHD
ncbi:hypothetical protein IJI86_00760 [Candidatus Saccharibacteria bacterium]|nr:hypothetical protein [Candidatus Saccharibacteria bacterium]